MFSVCICFGISGARNVDACQYTEPSTLTRNCNLKVLCMVCVCLFMFTVVSKTTQCINVTAVEKKKLKHTDI